MRGPGHLAAPLVGALDSCTLGRGRCYLCSGPPPAPCEAAPVFDVACGHLLSPPMHADYALMLAPGAQQARACRYVIEEDLLALALNGRYQKVDLPLDCRPGA